MGPRLPGCLFLVLMLAAAIITALLVSFVLAAGAAWRAREGHNPGARTVRLLGRRLSPRTASHDAAQALLLYATSTKVLQQTREEILVTLGIFKRRGPCNMLVFGVGIDSPMWAGFNAGGRTIFLEESLQWIGEVKKEVAAVNITMEVHHVQYNTKIGQAARLLEYAKILGREDCQPHQEIWTSRCILALTQLPM
eukprot:SM000247S08301  [mRNA]  locus=s247:43288:44521:- [translate_table: standard]